EARERRRVVVGLAVAVQRDDGALLGVAHAHRRDRADDGAVEIRAYGIAFELEVVPCQKGREDGLYLQEREGVAQALVAAAAERDVGEVLLVLLARRREAIGVEALGVFEDALHAVGDERGEEDP